MHDYQGVRIDVLSAVEAIRKRPEMYIGSDPAAYADRIVSSNP
jgi:DNA gyrase/topoisomerase IV subunit B